MPQSMSAVIHEVFQARSRPNCSTRSGLTRSYYTAVDATVSVCIANWNCRALLAACLRSLLDRPQGVTLEVIVVDNGSRDGAADMVEQEFPQVKLVRNEQNRGFSRANNQAASQAQGTYLFFLNNDTELPDFAVGKLVAYLENHPEAVVLGPRLIDDAGRTQAAHRTRPTVATLLHRTLLLRWTGLLRANYRRFRRQVFSDGQPQRVDVLMGAAMLMRREQFTELGGWNEEFAFGGEDMDLCHRARRLGQVVHHPGVSILHHGRASSRVNHAFAATQIAVGFAKYLRRTGNSRLSLSLYKLAVTLDTPLHLLVKSGEYLWRRLRRQPSRAAKTLNHLRGHWAFFRSGLGEFWRA